jgi:hypothetical protein
MIHGIHRLRKFKMMNLDLKKLMRKHLVLLIIIYNRFVVLHQLKQNHIHR